MKNVHCTLRDSQIRSEMSWGSTHTKIWTLKQLHHCTQWLDHEDKKSKRRRKKTKKLPSTPQSDRILSVDRPLFWALSVVFVSVRTGEHIQKKSSQDLIKVLLVLQILPIFADNFFLLCMIDVFKLSCKLEEYLSTSTPSYRFIKSIIMVFVFSSELLLS